MTDRWICSGADGVSQHGILQMPPAMQHSPYGVYSRATRKSASAISALSK